MAQTWFEILAVIIAKVAVGFVTDLSFGKLIWYSIGVLHFPQFNFKFVVYNKELIPEI